MSKLTAAQILKIIKEQETEMPTDQVCRRPRQSPKSSYKPKAKYEVMTVSDAQYLKLSEDWKAKSKRLLAENDDRQC